MLGLYEKATPKNMSWLERLNFIKYLGFDYLEMSIDESPARLKRLDWSQDEVSELKHASDATGIPILSMCLSGHRLFPLGSSDATIRKKGVDILEKAINLAAALGVRTIQLAGYDVYYEEKTVSSRHYFIENLRLGVKFAAAKQIMLAIEIMDDPFINSVTKYQQIKKQIPSPWLQVYPDIGNLSAWPENNPSYELELGINEMVAIHLKDTVSATKDREGLFKNVPFGQGDVDFLGILQTLNRLDYGGSFLIEMWSETSENPEEEILKAKQFLLPLLNEAGYLHDD